MFSDKLFHSNSFYFLGIGGVSMSALAQLAHEKGARVRGYDASDGPFVRKLREKGIEVSLNGEQEITEDTVVYTGAIPPNNLQMDAARRAGKRLISRAEFLGAVAEEYPHVLSVAGCHGKTSCTAMSAHIFRSAGREFTCHIGGEDSEFGNYYCAGDRYFITEACEYQRSFLSLKSECAVILNIDRDHMECYRDEADLIAAFSQFAKSAKTVVVNADDTRARELAHTASFGLYNGDYRAVDLRAEKEKYSFMVTERGIPLVRIRLRAAGKVYVYNALAAFAAARSYGLSAQEIKRGLEQFRGVKRRFERVGSLCGVPVICDYAHHPKELAAAIQTAKAASNGTVRVVFQPHTYSRTKDLMEEFVSVLKETENPIIYKTFAAREAFDGAGSAYALCANIPEARYVQSPEQLKARLCGALKKGDIVLVLGAGDIYEIARSLVLPPKR